MPDDKVKTGTYEAKVYGEGNDEYKVLITVAPKNEFNPNSQIVVTEVKVLDSSGGEVKGRELQRVAKLVEDKESGIPSKGSNPSLNGEGKVILPQSLITEACNKLDQRVAEEMAPKKVNLGKQLTTTTP